MADSQFEMRRELCVTKGVEPVAADLVEAVREVLNHAYYLLDDTANDNPPEVPQDSWNNLAKAVETLESMIPDDEQPCIIGVAARLISIGAGGSYRIERIGDIMEGGAGFWRACSGCQESNEGSVSTKDYPYSAAYRCQPGSGCRECGGIGVIWDDTDYSHYGEGPQPDPRDAEIERLRSELHRIKRTAEMSAGIMRDTRRTGGWDGAEKTARAFDGIADRARDAIAE